MLSMTIGTTMCRACERIARRRRIRGAVASSSLASPPPIVPCLAPEGSHFLDGFRRHVPAGVFASGWRAGC